MTVPRSRTFTHFQTHGAHVACGAETSWSQRLKAKSLLDVTRTADPEAVTCTRCLVTHAYRAAAARAKQ